MVLLRTHSEISEIGFRKGCSFLKVSLTTKLSKNLTRRKVAKQVRELNNKNDKMWMKEMEGNTKKY